MAKSRTVARRADSMDAFIGERIRAGRLLAKLSQGGLGEKIGVTLQQVQKYEKGVNRVGGGRMSKIADALNVSIGWLHGTEDKPQGRKRDHTADPLTELGQTRDGVRLAEAFNKIDSPTKRKSIVQSAEAMAA